MSTWRHYLFPALSSGGSSRHLSVLEVTMVVRNLHSGKDAWVDEIWTEMLKTLDMVEDVWLGCCMEISGSALDRQNGMVVPI